jgi:hypothetical protein
VSWLSRQCGILNISQLYMPPRPVTGITLRFYLYVPTLFKRMLGGKAVSISWSFTIRCADDMADWTPLGKLLCSHMQWHFIIISAPGIFMVLHSPDQSRTWNKLLFLGVASCCIHYQNFIISAVNRNEVFYFFPVFHSRHYMFRPMRTTFRWTLSFLRS